MSIKYDIVRAELAALLKNDNAHMSFEEAVKDFPLELINAKTILTPYSVWHLVEHIRIAQWDILEFIRDPLHISPEYPAGYRPDAYAKAEEHMWKDSVLRVKSDLASLIKIAVDEKNDLFAPIAHAPEYTIFRELLVVADHTAYHTGEIALLRQELNAWPKDHPYLTGQG